MRLLFLVFSLFLFSNIKAQKDIELVEERTSNQITIFAVNNTATALEMSLTLDLVGFTNTEGTAMVKVLEPAVKTFLTILTAPPGIACEYRTSVSYKQKKSQAITASTKPKSTTTGIQINPNKLNVFTQDGCARCEFVVGYLDKNNIPYLELNTTTHAPNQDLMFQKLEEAGFKGNTVQMPVIIKSGSTEYNIKDLPKYVQTLK